jgi:hypothetical protein
MKNEGKKLFQMFQTLFTMTNLHQASLPTVRAEFFSIAQKEKESVLAYSSRVDIVVSTMAKLGERTSTGQWIYVLGNGLRAEFQESKDGILYNKDGYDTVMKVKIKLLNEEAVLTGKSKRKENRSVQSSMTSVENEKDDEIALVSALKISIKKKNKKASKEASESSAPTAEEDSNDTALFSK